MFAGRADAGHAGSQLGGYQMRELTQTELSLIAGGTDGPAYLDATGLNLHLIFGPVMEPLVIGLLSLLQITPNTGDSEARFHLGGPVTPAPITFA
jgi:hypothetical protein